MTTRKLAARLGVQSPTLYWHIPNKAALVTAIAEAILEQQFPELASPAPEECRQDWLIGLAGRLRHALPAHPDGARIIAASQLSLKMAAISELAMSTLVGRDIPLRQARLIVLTVLRFTVGFVLEEQVGRPDADAAPYPTVTAGVAEYFQPGRTVDDLFRDCLEQIIHGPAANSSGPRPGTG